MDELDTMSDLIFSVRNVVESLQDHRAELEAALRVRGFTGVVQEIRNNMVKKYPPRDQSYLGILGPGEDGFFQLHAHPLLLEDIVRILSQYLDFESLQAARTVHPTWNNAILSQRYLQRTKLVIRFFNWDFWEFKHLLDAFPLEKGESVKTPTTLSITNLGFEADPEPLTTWLKVYGPKFTRLEIGEDEEEADGDYDEEMDFLKTKLFIGWLTEMLPNLKELQIDNFEFQGCLFTDGIPSLPNLKFLEVGSGIKRSLGDPVSIKQFVTFTGKNLETLRLWLRPKLQIQYLNICHEAGILKNLTALDLSENKLSMPVLHLLITANFKQMKRFVFQMETKHMDAGTDQEFSMSKMFGQLLDNVKNTLEELSGGLARDLFRFPEMKELKKLESYVCDSAHARSIELLTLSPKLDSLILVAPHHPKDFGQADDHRLIFGKIFPPELGFQNNSLKNLDLSNFPYDQAAFSRLVISLPALEILSIGCTNIFGEITWSLTQFFKDLGNLKKLVDLTVSFQRTFGWGEIGAKEFNDGIALGFRNLLSLKKCSMQFDQRFPISEQAFTKGFMKSPSLRRLQLRKFVIGPEIRPLVDALLNKNVEVDLREWFCSLNDSWPVIYCKYK